MTEDHVLTEAEIDEALARLPGWEVRDNWLRRSFTTPVWRALSTRQGEELLP